MKHFFALGLLTVLALMGPAIARGQGSSRGNSPLVGWLRLSSETTLRGPWSLYSEVETRQGNSRLTAQHLGRVGLRWHAGPSFSFTTGYVLAYNQAQPNDPAETLPEHRFYQEVALADATGRLRVSHRLRAEERWLRPSYEAAFHFAPRLRYQLRLVAPLQRAGRLAVGTVYVVAADELFAGLGGHTGRSALEENRASLGLGYRLSRSMSAELAYLYQTQSTGPQGESAARNALQCSLAFAPSRPLALVRR
jgi:hypothetical protein